MNDPKAAVQKVRDAHAAFIDNLKLKDSTRGEAYEEAMRQDNALWAEYRHAKDELYEQVIEVFGVHVFELKSLSCG